MKKQFYKCYKSVVSTLLLLLMFSGSSMAQNTTNDFENIQTISEGLNAPLRLAVAPDGEFYVTDANRKSILKYDASGNLLNEIVVGGKPVSVAVNSKGELFIGDGNTGHIYQYSGGGMKVFYSETQY